MNHDLGCELHRIESKAFNKGLYAYADVNFWQLFLGGELTPLTIPCTRNSSLTNAKCLLPHSLLRHIQYLSKTKPYFYIIPIRNYDRTTVLRF